LLGFVGTSGKTIFQEAIARLEAETREVPLHDYAARSGIVAEKSSIRLLEKWVGGRQKTDFPVDCLTFRRVIPDLLAGLRKRGLQIPI
jgi:hypothetical protein